MRVIQAAEEQTTLLQPSVHLVGLDGAKPVWKIESADCVTASIVLTVSMYIELSSSVCVTAESAVPYMETLNSN